MMTSRGGLLEKSKETVQVRGEWSNAGRNTVRDALTLVVT